MSVWRLVGAASWSRSTREWSWSTKTWAPSRGTTASRSMSDRTVSTAYRGMPSARPTIAVRARLGRSRTSPSTRAVIASSGSGATSTTVLRRPSAREGRASRSSGRPIAMTNSATRLVASRCSIRSRRAASACWTSSKSRTTGRSEPTRSTKVVHATNRSVRSNVARSPPLTSASTRGASHSASSSSAASSWIRVRTCCSTSACDSVSVRPSRERTISANAQNATPVAVGQAAAAVPAHAGRQSVDVLLELPAEPGLADAGHPGDHGQPSLARRPRWRGTAP